MNILATLNSGYLFQLAVMLRSITESTPEENLDVYIMNRSLDESEFELTKRRVGSDRVRLIDIKTNEKELEGAPVTSRYPAEMYFRIFAAKYLPENIDKILYLDPDLVVINDIRPLYNTDITGYYFAAASHVFGPMQTINEIRLNMEENSPYINSGVMLMNLSLLREKQDMNDVFEFIKNNKQRLILPDQDIISALYGPMIFPLNPYKYNMTERLLFRGGIGNNIDCDWVEKNSVIIHYLGRNKPWKERYIGKMRKYYTDIAEKIK